ncbi:30S ribosomal protein S3 [Candidatus Gracilibacteria bacterium]|nr:30S ribosomal protein S3 [Candidatus Gracilibacteria bacterium]NUJ98625.1 30S ribosomal protein S3 [Candidatus Gracilibacteria bacterium]
MGHKVSPIAFRIPYIKTWKSSWFAGKRDYSKYLGIDLKVREILKKQLTGIPLGDILVSRDQDTLNIDVYTSKAALILGKTGENLENLQENVSKQTGLKVVINVKEIRKPDINAKIVGYMVANQMEKRMPYKRAIKQAIAKAMEKGAKGIKIKVGGRLNGTEIARKETFKEGNIPTQTMRADIDYSTTRAETIYGTIGLKVWIYKGDIFKKN